MVDDKPTVKKRKPRAKPRSKAETVKRTIDDAAAAAAMDALNRIIALANSDDDKIALLASQELLNRSVGKPITPQKKEVNISIGDRLSKAIKRVDNI